VLGEPDETEVTLGRHDPGRERAEHREDDRGDDGRRARRKGRSGRGGHENEVALGERRLHYVGGKIEGAAGDVR
jgi:hypothetical protein